MTTTNTFATVLGCMDGRCQEKTFTFAKDLFGKEFIDTITEPGIDGILAGIKHPVYEPQDIPIVIKNIKAKAGISAQGHGSTQCLVVAHCSCAGNPVELELHKEHLTAAVERVRAWELFEDVKGAVFDDEWNLHLLT